MIIRLLTLMLVMCAPTLGHTQDAAPSDAAAQQSIDPRSTAVATDIVKSFDMKAMLQGVLGAMSKAMVPLISQANPGQDSKIQKIVIDAVQKSMLSHMDEMEKNKVTVYTQMFSYDELVQLRDFYASPVGQKMIKSTPEMMSRSLTLNQVIMMSAMHDANAQVIQELKDDGMKVPKELGV